MIDCMTIARQPRSHRLHPALIWGATVVIASNLITLMAQVRP